MVRWGFNSRLDNLQAAILNFQLDQYEQIVFRRRHIAALYVERLGNIPDVVLPPAPDSDPDHFDVYQNFEIEAENRDALKTFLSDRGVGTLIQWNGEAIHHLEALGFKQKLPHSDRMFKRMLMLPMNMSLSDEDVYYVCDTVRAFYGFAL